MSRNGISYSDVANAAIKVQAQSGNPTVDRIREVLGTGSKSTIARHLKDWKTNNGPIASACELPADLVALVTGLWECLQNKAEQQILQNEQEASQKISELDNGFKLEQKKNIEQQEQISNINELLIQEKAANATLEENLANERIEASKNQDRITSLEANLTENKDENTKLHTHLHNMQNNLEHYQASMQKLQQEQSLAMDKQKSQFEMELSSLRQQLFTSTSDNNQLSLRIEQLQQQARIFEGIEQRNKDLEQNIKTVEIKLNVLEEKHKETIDNNQTMIQNIDTKTQQLVESEQKIAVAASRLNDSEKALQMAEDKIATLRHEILFIVQEKANFEGQIKQLKTTLEMAT